MDSVVCEVQEKGEYHLEQCSLYISCVPHLSSLRNYNYLPSTAKLTSKVRDLLSLRYLDLLFSKKPSNNQLRPTLTQRFLCTLKESSTPVTTMCIEKRMKFAWGCESHALKRDICAHRHTLRQLQENNILCASEGELCFMMFLRDVPSARWPKLRGNLMQCDNKSNRQGKHRRRVK